MTARLHCKHLMSTVGSNRLSGKRQHCRTAIAILRAGCYHDIRLYLQTDYVLTD